MVAIEQLKEDVRTGQIDANRLVDLIGTLQYELQAAKQRIAELEKHLAGTPGSTRVDQPFSRRAEEKRQEARGKKRRQRQGNERRGRVRTADKVAQAERTEEVDPDGLDPRGAIAPFGRNKGEDGDESGLVGLG